MDSPIFERSEKTEDAKQTRIKILEALKQAKKILIPLHINIDGDSVGSALALNQILKSWGKDVEVVTADPLAEVFLFLPGAKEIKESDPAEMDLSQYDLFVAVDNGLLSRFSRKENFKPPSDLTIINIDHHHTNDSYGDLNYVVSQAPSTTGILYDLMKEWNLKINKEIALCLLTGIFTDTGGFQYECTNPESMEKAAKLIRTGVDYSEVVNQMTRSWSPSALNLWVKILKNSKIQNQFAYSTLTLKEVKETDIERQELSGARTFALSYLLRAAKNTDITALLYEEQEGRVRVSLRSRSGFNVAEIAEKMGGGGHAHSAAFNFQGKMKEAINKTTKLVGETLK